MTKFDEAVFYAARDAYNVNNPRTVHEWQLQLDAARCAGQNPHSPSGAIAGMMLLGEKPPPVSVDPLTDEIIAPATAEETLGETPEETETAIEGDTLEAGAEEDLESAKGRLESRRRRT